MFVCFLKNKPQQVKLSDFYEFFTIEIRREFELWIVHWIVWWNTPISQKDWQVNNIDHLFKVQCSAGSWHSCEWSLTCTTHLNIAANQVHPLMATAFLSGNAPQRIHHQRPGARQHRTPSESPVSVPWWFRAQSPIHRGTSVDWTCSSMFQRWDDQIEIWGVWGPGRHFELFVVFLEPFRNIFFMSLHRW